MRRETFPASREKEYMSAKRLKRVSQKEHVALKKIFNKFPYVRTLQQNIEIIASFKKDFFVFSFNYSGNSDFLTLAPSTLKNSNTYLLNFDYVILLDKDILSTFISS